MADNFLEKRMDDYRRGRLGSVSGSRIKAAKPVAAIHLHGLTSLISPLRELGAAVSFSGVDEPAGRQIAQSTGSTFCPMALADAVATMAERRGALDGVVTLQYRPETTILIAAPDNQDIPEGVHMIDGSLAAHDQARLVVALSKIHKPLAVTPRG